MTMTKTLASRPMLLADYKKVFPAIPQSPLKLTVPQMKALLHDPETRAKALIDPATGRIAGFVVCQTETVTYLKLTTGSHSQARVNSVRISQIHAVDEIETYHALFTEAKKIARQAGISMVHLWVQGITPTLRDLLRQNMFLPEPPYSTELFSPQAPATGGDRRPDFWHYNATDSHRGQCVIDAILHHNARTLID